MKATVFAAALACTSLFASTAAARQGLDLSEAGAGFVGVTRCSSKQCHGAPQVNLGEADRGTASPHWKWAHTSWRSQADHHSRAFRSLTSPEGRKIASYMGIDATQSRKCTACHAPAARLAQRDGRKSSHKREHGVACEHCHGPAEKWLREHTRKDWTRKEAAAQGFYDNEDLTKRARLCASCHVDIDHEIVAGGHPPLQYELVAYAEVMRHWSDARDQNAGEPSVNPTLWAIGQAEGLRITLEMIAERAGAANYQSLGQFAHFKGQNCYRCHHKLVDDAQRQARGHYLMIDAILARIDGGERSRMAEAWNGLTRAVDSSADAAASQARALAETATALRDRIRRSPIGQGSARQILRTIAGDGARLSLIRRFRYPQPTRRYSTVVDVKQVESPWWYTSGGPQQAALAVEALCAPAFGEKRCAQLIDRRDELAVSVTPWKYVSSRFTKALDAIRQGLR